MVFHIRELHKKIPPGSILASGSLKGMIGYEAAFRGSGTILLSFVLEADKVTELL